MSVRPIGMDGQRLGGEDNESDGVAKWVTEGRVPCHVMTEVRLLTTHQIIK